jgi:hypothetical protein
MADYLFHILLAFAALAMYEVWRGLLFDRDF